MKSACVGILSIIELKNARRNIENLYINSRNRCKSFVCSD